jgi:hypothetical protein
MFTIINALIFNYIDLRLLIKTQCLLNITVPPSAAPKVSQLKEKNGLILSEMSNQYDNFWCAGGKQ